jgi:hypothetical protein
MNPINHIKLPEDILRYVCTYLRDEYKYRNGEYIKQVCITRETKSIVEKIPQIQSGIVSLFVRNEYSIRHSFYVAIDLWYGTNHPWEYWKYNSNEEHTLHCETKYYDADDIDHIPHTYVDVNHFGIFRELNPEN